ncbi:cytochrome P450 [Lentinula raphanica]|nr:cytochrome P450 [Lentinula raphanica]
MRQPEFRSYIPNHGILLDLKSSGLFPSIAILILSASIWTILSRRQRLRSCASLTLLNQLRGPPSQSWLQGNYTHVFSNQGWDFHKMLADNYGSVVRIMGPLRVILVMSTFQYLHSPLFSYNEQSKQLYTFDPKAMYHIFIKVSTSSILMSISINESNDVNNQQGTVFQPHGVDTSAAIIFGKGLLSTAGESHRKQRKMLNPVFSIAHMRSMIPIFYDVVDQLRDALSRRVQGGPQEIDLLGWMARTALELIGQSGLGYSFDDMMDDVPKHRYSVIIKDFVPTLTELSFARFYVLPLLIKVLPKSVRVFLMNILPWRTLHNARDMANYMHDLAVQIYQEKKHALEEGDEAVLKQIGKGKDLLSILMKANMKADSEDKLEELELIGQVCLFLDCVVFFITHKNKITVSDVDVHIRSNGHHLDFTKSAMSRILHLLALHPVVQDKLRDEVVFALRECGGNHLSYDELMGLPYLDAICRETLRLYAPIPSVIRKSTEDTIVPFSQPVVGKDGKVVTEVFLPKGTTVFISILNANRNPDLWGPDALEWKPERWLSPLPEAVTKAEIPAVYSHLMTFIGGLFRSFRGFKFSQLEMKVVIAMLVENFKFSLAPEKEIFWQMSLITSPVVGDSDSENSDHPQLPLIVELAK